MKQISDNEIYFLIKYIKSVVWRVAKRLSYIKDARCLKVKSNLLVLFLITLLVVTIKIIKSLQDKSDNFINSLDNTEDV